MNGVRRFLGGGGLSNGSSGSPAQPPPPPPPLSNDIYPLSLAPITPLTLPAKQSQGPSWPPSSPTAYQAPQESPKFTQGLFIRKERTSKPTPLSDSNVNVNNSPSSSPTSALRTVTTNSMSSPSRTPQSLTSSPRVNTNIMPASASANSSPRTNYPRPIPRKTVPLIDGVNGNVNGTSTSPVPPPPSSIPPKRYSGSANTRDELIMSILASEALVDCHDLPILSSEEVEDLKKEHQVLSSRLGAATQKLATETKIRDAAVSLSKVNAQHKKVSKQTEEQLEAAERRVEVAQKELWKLSERLNEVYKKLLEHRAGVLSHSVKSMEKKMNPIAVPMPPLLERATSGLGLINGDDGTSSGVTSPSISTPSSTQTRFDGAHFFAGHVDAVVPKPVLSGEAAAIEIASLEEKLKAATNALKDAGKKQAELTRELALVRLEKDEVETLMGMELQSAEETIKGLEKELPKLEALNDEVDQLREEREMWEVERARMEQERERQVEDLKQRMEMIQAQNNGELQGREASQREMVRAMEEELRTLKAELESKEDEWAQERARMEDERMEDLARLQEEMDRIREQDASALQQAHQDLDRGLDAVKSIVKQHGIVLFSRDSSLPGLLESIGTHLDSVHQKLDSYAVAQKEWEATRRKMEDDIRAGLDKRESLTRQVEEARREREDATREVRALKEASESPFLRSPLSPSVGLPPIPLANFSPPPPPPQPIEYAGDAAKIVALLLPLWHILPSPEARASKFANSQRNFRPGSPSNSGSANTNPVSLSDLDVRTLKTLYDIKPPASPKPRLGGTSSPINAGTFTVEAFATRVQALIADDKALIERLIRFAQAHDLLKKNAERAQKLAQETNGALETYQKQVKTLEDRNMTLATKQSTLQEEIQNLQETIDRLSLDKQQVETLAAEQAQTVRQLTEANTILSAKTLNLAQEAASAPEQLRKQLETQRNQLEVELKKCKDELEECRGEIERLRMSEQSQSMALLEELNSVQNDNEVLRAQLRAANAGKK